jgi:ArsR family transcriptional regulator
VKDKQVEKELYEYHAEMCKVFSHPTRLQIINILRDQELNVTELAERIGVGMGNLSQHLALMKNLHILRARKGGNQVYYRIENPKMLKAFDILREILLERLKRESLLVR